MSIEDLVDAVAQGEFVVPKEFVEDGDGSVPLNGSVPDMTASSDMYIAMQKVYGDKARQDYENVLGRVRAIFNSADIDEASVVAFPYAETVDACPGATYARNL